MSSYYIKKHFKTSEDYPREEGIHFSERAFSRAEKLAKSHGFLLYEAGESDTKGLKGAKAIYGYGKPVGEPYLVSEPRKANGKLYPYAVEVIVEFELPNRFHGVDLEVLREKYGIEMRPVLGGLIEIPKEVFEEIKQLLKQDKLNFI
ncbi:hypothetical protein [Alkaliphilus peptidifermentans]|uniref:Uncharacterized protein n=1 Tax=Alkaliphilus peptidifermentans DSM 18978 TaxID=1120976 RepID=A0A1G5ITB9_9FIRM|nr:hypothetical protein [Alkaliphilus peptidifermentans]SCY79345.1 hypothetical protein SAMN03080606_02511 [Alkaliphilus peptidifermentans DSM 18978]